MLEKSGEASFFAKICVDKDPRTGLRPPVINKYGITEVPTIIVENRRLGGYAAFNWLKTRIESSNDQVNSLHSRQNKQSVNMQQLNQQQQNPNNIEAFNVGGSFADNHLNIQGNNNTESIYTPDDGIDIEAHKGNFILPEDNITSSVMNTPEPARNEGGTNQLKSISISKDKLKSKQFDNEFNKLIQERDTHIQKQPQRM